MKTQVGKIGLSPRHLRKKAGLDSAKVFSCMYAVDEKAMHACKEDIKTEWSYIDPGVFLG